MRAAGLTMLVLGACPRPLDSEDPPWLYGMAGEVVLDHLPEDAFYHGYGYAAAMFYDDAQSTLGPTDCLLVSGWCVDRFPGVGEEVAVGGTGFDVGASAFYNVGASVRLGDVAMQSTDEFQVVAYDGPFSGTFTGGASVGLVTEDLDYGPHEGTAELVLPSPMEVTAPDPLAPITLGPGEPLALTWQASGDGDLFYVLARGDAVVVRGIDDTGSASLPTEALGFAGVIGGATLVLARQSVGEADVNGNTIRLVARSEQWLYVDYVDPTGRTGLDLSDTCAAADAADPIHSGAFVGHLGDAVDAMNPGAAGCTGGEAGGAERLARVVLLPGETLTADAAVGGGDAALYFLDDCGRVSCLVGADATGFDGSETVSWTNDTGDNATVYVVVDTVGGGGPFALDLGVSD